MVQKLSRKWRLYRAVENVWDCLRTLRRVLLCVMLFYLLGYFATLGYISALRSANMVVTIPLVEKAEKRHEREKREFEL